MSNPTAETTNDSYVPEFGFANADPLLSFAYLAGPVESLMGKLGPQTRVLDIGFVNLQFRGAGRAPFLWMSMVMSGDKPAR